MGETIQRPRSRQPKLGAEFGKLWSATAVGNIGDGITLAAGPLFIASLTDDPRLVGLAVFVQQLPWLLFSLISGAYVDRLDRRRLVMLVNLLRGIVIGGLAVAVAFDAANVAVVYAAFFLLGTAETLADNASSALVPAIVDKESLPRANSRLVAVFFVGNQFIAPPVGAALFVVAAALPFGVNAAAFVLAALLIGWLKADAHVPEPVERRPMRVEIAEGLRWLWRNKVVRMLAVSMCLMNVTLMAGFAILVLYARQRLGLGEIGFGLLLTSSAIGGLLGTLISPPLQRRFANSTLLRVGLVIETLTHVALALAETAWLGVLIMVIFGLHGAIWGTVSQSWRHRVVPDALRGRVQSVYLLFSVGGSAIGSLISGPVAAGVGITGPFWMSAVLMAVLTVTGWRTFGRHLTD